jgi:23S rRNA G2445 N2-methylase RlmL
MVQMNSIDKLVTNPPWGRTLGKELDYNIFYPRLLLEFRRVLKQDGVLVLLTSEKLLFEKLIRDNKRHFWLEQQFNIFVSGRKAGIYKLRKR